MTLFDNKGRLSRNTFREVKGILDLDDIQSPAFSVDGSETNPDSTETLFSLPDFPLPQSEPCFVTKSIAFTNERTYWIQPGRTREETFDIQRHIQSLRIGGVNFRLRSGNNITNLDCFIAKSLNQYPFIAITPSRETLIQLIEQLQDDCNERQIAFNESGADPDRCISYGHPALQNARYELVALYPEHFLPAGLFLTVFDRNTGTYKNYVPSADRRLREMPGDLTCSPPASFSAPTRDNMLPLSPYIVALHASVRFKRYLQQVQQNPPMKPLPEDVLELMALTAKVVDLIYWEAEIDETTPGGRIGKFEHDRKRSLGMLTSRWYPHRVVYEDFWSEDADLGTRVTAMQFDNVSDSSNDSAQSIFEDDDGVSSDDTLIDPA